ncbi:S1C family serine protease [Cellulosilyticum sp. I15G10I2]|uniref:S1C family serine protease n=1 Tax=Cellulosilyticum sp. I15G10I2 TaxID=1892843 RepID=UPI00085C95EC|nr:trypsin-like peptidase domain-containing protein [Cellulosilyticum sp. I15G10I2]
MYDDNHLNPFNNGDDSPYESSSSYNNENQYIDVNKFSESSYNDAIYDANPMAYKEQIPSPPYQEPSYSQQIPVYRSDEHASQPQKKKGSFGKFITGLVVVSLVGGLSIGASFAFLSPYANDYYNTNHKNNGLINNGQDGQLTGNILEGANRVLPLTTNNSITDIANNIGPSVVSIKNNQVVTTWYGEFNQAGLGSGVIFKQDDKKIYIVSNAHVVEGSNSLVVNFLGNTKVEAEMIGADTVTDIAVIAVEKSDIPAEALNDIKVAPLGDSDYLHVGELAVAIGNPIDEAYNNTVTVGVISALNREVQLVDKKLKLIQTDAAINPGNSGGALVGPTGEVIGINTIKLVDSQIEGMGFAIPINDIKPIIEEILQNGKISRPALGIVGKDIDVKAAELYEIPIGVYIVEVAAGSSAELAGMRANDILFQFDGIQITGMNQLKELLNTKKVGDAVEVKIIRNNEKKTLQLKLREMPKVSYR